MLRFFIIAAEIIVLVMILRSPFVQYLFADVQASISNWLIHVTTIPERRELKSLRDKINIQLSPLKPYQQSYVEQITQSKDGLNQFYVDYCKTGEINPNFSGTKRLQICQIIEQSPFMN